MRTISSQVFLVIYHCCCFENEKRNKGVPTPLLSVTRRTPET